MTLVTFDGQIGAGGPILGRRISVMHGLRYVDRLVLPQAVETARDTVGRSSLSDKFWRMAERAVSGLALGNSAGDPYFATPETALLPLTWDDSPHAPKGIAGMAVTPDDLLSTGRAVVVERAGALEFREAPSVLRIGLFSSWKDRVERVMRQEGLSSTQTAGETIFIREEAQRRYFNERHGADPEDRSLYDMVIDTSRQSIEMAVLAVSRRISALNAAASPAT
jgi:hypothetical protein